MNLLLINYEYPPIGGGAGNATHFMSKALAALGHEVCVLTTGWKDQTGHSKVNNVHLYQLPAWRSDPSAASTLEKLHFVWKAKFAIQDIIKKHKIEGVIIYFTIPCGLLSSSLQGIPYIISLRGGDVPGLVKEIDWIHRLIKKPRRNILSKAKAIIANGEGLAELSRKADPYPVSVIPNGVDTDFFHPPQNKILDQDTTQFLFVGRFHPQKNLHCLLKQMARLKKETSKGFILHLVGNGPLEQELKDLVKQLDIEEHTQWHGWLNKEELRDLHQKCEVFINPSHYEGLPNAVLEAMASELLVIVSDIPGNYDLIHGGAGYVYSHKSDDDLYQSMKEAHLTPNRQFSQTARKRALEKYSWKKVAQQYVDIFN